jgi:hypothetical protein
MMAGLSLITAAIVHWNTVYLDRAVRQLRAQEPARKTRRRAQACDRRGGDCGQNATQRPVSLIRLGISLIARFNSLKGDKEFPVRMRRELARESLIYWLFFLPLMHSQALIR